MLEELVQLVMKRDELLWQLDETKLRYIYFLLYFINILSLSLSLFPFILIPSHFPIGKRKQHKLITM